MPKCMICQTEHDPRLLCPLPPDAAARADQSFKDFLAMREKGVLARIAEPEPDTEEEV